MSMERTHLDSLANTQARLDIARSRIRQALAQLEACSRIYLGAVETVRELEIEMAALREADRLRPVVVEGNKQYG